MVLIEFSEWYCENKYPLDSTAVFILEESHVKVFVIPAQHGELSK